MSEEYDWEAHFDRAMDNLNKRKVDNVIRDQGMWHDEWGPAVECHVCGKWRQWLIQCNCGAP